MLHILVKSFMAWYLINGKRWDGREEIHLLISGFISIYFDLHCSAAKFSFSFFFHFVLAFSYVVSLDDLPDRGAGFISLENLLFFAKTFSVNSQT